MKSMIKRERECVIARQTRLWCERGDLNPHGYPRDPKSRASASSATLAGAQFVTIDSLSSNLFIIKGLFCSDHPPLTGIFESFLGWPSTRPGRDGASNIANGFLLIESGDWGYGRTWHSDSSIRPFIKNSSNGSTLTKAMLFTMPRPVRLLRRR